MAAQPPESGTDSYRLKRPESVLVVVYSLCGAVLMMRRVDHPEYWQSVTGSMNWDENDPGITATRELYEETGLDGAELVDLEITNHYEIYPEWRHRFAEGVTHNTEHVFALRLPEIQIIHLNPAEHSEYTWLPAETALVRVSSETNCAAIEHLLGKMA